MSKQQTDASVTKEEGDTSVSMASMMEQMQREALAEQAIADGQVVDEPLSFEAMQELAAAEQEAANFTEQKKHDLKSLLNHLLFDFNTMSGRVFNYSILLLILATVAVSMLDTLADVHAHWGALIEKIQVYVLYIFLVEYLLRLYAAHRRMDYVLSFHGLIDAATVMPIFFGIGAVPIVRMFRLLRLFKLAMYFPVLASLLRSVSGAANMMFAVLGTIAAVSIFAGNLAYMLEPETFHNAFLGTWWALVTMSTVGYGDLVPHSTSTMLLGVALILIGICVVAMMTAVIAVRVGRMVNMTKKCFECERAISSEAAFCQFCGQDQSDEIDLFTDDE
ncbi:MAG: ion transporter [Mariprofundus sp.]|nr:ion transporter [Mariprofundus sp.]